MQSVDEAILHIPAIRIFDTCVFNFWNRKRSIIFPGSSLRETFYVYTICYAMQCLGWLDFWLLCMWECTHAPMRSVVFDSRVLKEIFGPNRVEVTWGWRKLHNEKPYILYSSPDIIRMIKSRRIKWDRREVHAEFW
jgi:hypothetical protein